MFAHIRVFGVSRRYPLWYIPFLRAVEHDGSKGLPMYAHDSDYGGGDEKCQNDDGAGHGNDDDIDDCGEDDGDHDDDDGEGDGDEDEHDEMLVIGDDDDDGDENDDDNDVKFQPDV